MKKLLCLAVVAAFAPCVGSAPQPVSSGIIAIAPQPVSSGVRTDGRVGSDGRKYFFDARMGVEYYIDENGNKQYMGDAQVLQNYQPQIVPGVGYILPK